MVRPTPMRRRAFLFISGLAAAGIQQPVAAQQVDNGTDGNETNQTDQPTIETDQPDDELDTEPDETTGFSPEVTVDCYYARVDAEAYDSVELLFADGTIETFDGPYTGQTEFGFRGDGRLDADSETVTDVFRGPIARLTVVAGEASETVAHDGPCVFQDLAFECESASYSQGDDVRVAFSDGSFKMWDAPADPNQTRFGSPGRIVETITEESADIEVSNPNPDCEPGAYATVFECTEVTVTDAEFVSEPTFDRVELEFVDGTTQAFGNRSDGPNFTAPETFAGTDEHAGKLIEAIAIEQLGGDIFFRLVNPTVDECEPPTAFEPEISVDRYVVTVEADSYDRVSCEFGDGTTETFDGEFSGRQQFGYAGAEALWEADADRTFETFYGPIERCRVEQGDNQQAVDSEAAVDEPVITRVQFDCSTVEFSGTANDIRLYYADGSFDWCEREQSGAVRYGSPGRLLGGVYIADQDLWLANPATDCEPDQTQIGFECRAVRLTAAEFGPEPGAINRCQLIFTDGSDQVFGDEDPDATAFETPAVFAGVEEHAGKVISSVICELPGRDVFIVRTNPNAADCEAGSPGETAGDGDDGGGDGDNGESTVRDVTALAESDTEVASAAESVVTVDSGEPLRAPPETHPEPVTSNEGAIAIDEPDIETASGLVDQVPWWGWVAALGGAGGTVSYLVARAVGEESGRAEPAAVDSAASAERETGGADGESKGSTDNVPNRWDKFGSR